MSASFGLTHAPYKHTTTLEDEIRIFVSVEKYTGVKLKFKYVMTKIDSDTVVFTGESEHCFLDENHMSLIVRKRFPDVDCILKSLVPPIEQEASNA